MSPWLIVLAVLPEDPILHPILQLITIYKNIKCVYIVLETLNLALCGSLALGKTFNFPGLMFLLVKWSESQKQ